MGKIPSLWRVRQMVDWKAIERYGPWRPARPLPILLLILLTTGLYLPSLMLVLQAQGRQTPIPTLAYYYIWFDTNSWRCAKTDYPLLGHYNSDDRAVMRQHVQWAKAAGDRKSVV